MTPETKEWYDMAVMDFKYYDYADALTPYGVSVRYPNELFLEERHVKEALECSGEILRVS